MKKPSFLKHYNWRLLLMRVLLNGIALLLTAAVLPNLAFEQFTVRNLLFLAVMMGILNALIKPILQLLTLSLLFASYGIVVVLINSVILLLLAWIFPDRIAITSIWAALLGGLLLGAIGSFLEAVFGLTIPIVPESETELRKRLETQTSVEKRIVAWTESEGAASLSTTTTTNDVPNSVPSNPPPVETETDLIAAEVPDTQPELSPPATQTTGEEVAQ